jgi:glycosyltransferase involved in cell wall biosynthesis
MHGPTEFLDLRHYRLAEKLSSASFVVCISDFARSQLMALCEPGRWPSLRVVHVGIPVGQFTRSSPPPVPDGGGRVLYIGRLVPEKGQTVLLEAIAELVGEGLDVELTLAGDGALKPRLEQLAADLGIGDRVEFPGAVGQEELRELYETATAFCLPSFGEGVPVVLMEAMAMEVPVLSTRIAGIPELIEHGRSGLLVAPGRADQLTAALRELLSDPELHRRLAVGGREKVLAEFDAERSAEQLRDLLVEMLGRSSAAPQPAVSKTGA